MNLQKYLLAAFLGIGICGGISVDFANGMDDNTYGDRLPIGNIGDDSSYGFALHRSQNGNGILVDPDGNGNCGYTAIGMTREDVANILRRDIGRLRLDGDLSNTFTETILSDEFYSLTEEEQTKYLNDPTLFIDRFVTPTQQNTWMTSELIVLIGELLNIRIHIIRNNNFPEHTEENVIYLVNVNNNHWQRWIPTSNLTDEPIIIKNSKINLHEKEEKTKKPKPPLLSDDKSKLAPKKKLSKRDQDDDISEATIDEDGYSVYKSNGKIGRKNVFFTDVIRRIKTKKDKDYVKRLLQDKKIFTDRTYHLICGDHIFITGFNQLPQYTENMTYPSAFVVHPSNDTDNRLIQQTEEYQISYQILSRIHYLIQQGAFEIIYACLNNSPTEGYIDIRLTQDIQIHVNGTLYNVTLCDNTNEPVNAIRIAIKVDERTNNTNRKFHITIKSLYPL